MPLVLLVRSAMQLIRNRACVYCCKLLTALKVRLQLRYPQLLWTHYQTCTAYHGILICKLVLETVTMSVMTQHITGFMLFTVQKASLLVHVI